MKLIPLTKGQFAKVDDEDYEELSKYKWSAYWNNHTFSFIVRTSDKFFIRKYGCLMHRFIMNCPKRMVVDHKNHDTLDNRKENLRICTYNQNSYNSRKIAKSQYRYKGVYFCRGKWRSYINHEKKRYYVGTFNSEVEGALGYNEAASYLHGEFACLNNVSLNNDKLFNNLTTFEKDKIKQKMVTPKKLPAKKAIKKVKKQHGGKRIGGGRKKVMVYPKEMGPTKPVAFQVPTKKIDEVKKLVQDKLAEYRKTV